MEKETEQELIKKMIGFQKEEITSSIIYRKLAAKEKDPHNRQHYRDCSGTFYGFFRIPFH